MFIRILCTINIFSWEKEGVSWKFQALRGTIDKTATYGFKCRHWEACRLLVYCGGMEGGQGWRIEPPHHPWTAVVQCVSCVISRPAILASVMCVNVRTRCVLEWHVVDSGGDTRLLDIRWWCDTYGWLWLIRCASVVLSRACSVSSQYRFTHKHKTVLRNMGSVVPAVFVWCQQVYSSHGILCFG